MHKELDFTELRKGGIIKQRQKDYFILRTRIPGGYLKAEFLPKMLAIAKKYGKGYVHLSTRQCIEIAWIHVRDLDKLIKELKKLGIERGACGPRSRNIVACPGSSVCRFGFTDTEALSAELNKNFFGKDVPKKFKIGLSGCMNSCSKPQENDLGFMAQGEPEVDLKLCIKCALCAKVCEEVCRRGGREPAIIMDKDKMPVYRKEFCFFEGDCVRVCPVNAWKVKKTGYAVFLGGKIGRFPMLGYKIADFVDEKKIPSLIEKAIETYNKIAKKGERLGDAIIRTGLEEVKKQIL
ncbi:MAG: hypothetical protein PHO42_04430 [Candidatus Omnitrophica bacterium]|nr:hypothetical protein [Candidatus Omnitrophota bacterium]